MEKKLMNLMFTPKEEDLMKKRSIVLEIPTFTDIKQFLNTKIKVLRNKTIEGMDWLREKLASIDLDKNATTKNRILDEIKKNDDKTILSLIKGDKDLGSRIKDLFQNASQPAAEWLNDILIAREDDDNKIVFLNETQQKELNGQISNHLSDNKVDRKRRSASSMFKGILGRSKAKMLHTEQAPVLASIVATSTTVLETVSSTEATSTQFMVEKIAALDQGSSGKILCAS
jgi:hypothetical protein